MSKRHSCFNRPPMKPCHYMAGTVVEILPHGVPIAKVIITKVEHANSTDCAHTKHDPDDPECEGCKWHVRASASSASADANNPELAQVHAEAQLLVGDASVAAHHLLSQRNNCI